MPKEPNEHLPLEGEVSDDQHNLVGSVLKKATSPLIVERAVEYAEAIDLLKGMKEDAEAKKDELIQAFHHLQDPEQYVQVSTMSGKQYRFFLSKEEKLCKEEA